MSSCPFESKQISKHCRGYHTTWPAATTAATTFKRDKGPDPTHTYPFFFLFNTFFSSWCVRREPILELSPCCINPNANVALEAQLAEAYNTLNLHHYLLWQSEKFICKIHQWIWSSLSKGWSKIKPKWSAGIERQVLSAIECLLLSTVKRIRHSILCRWNNWTVKEKVEQNCEIKCILVKLISRIWAKS